MSLYKIFDTLKARFLNLFIKKDNSPSQKQTLHIDGNNNSVTQNIAHCQSGVGTGGKGGNATAEENGFAKGGPGGRGGPWGSGGNGGDAHAKGNAVALGGEGGEAAQFDRGGKGGRSAAEIHGIPNRQLPDGSWLWDYGRGGDGASPTKKP
jgi:hypothetical protein